MLIIFGELPGTGKTTIARDVARQRHATYLRIDSIEQAVRSTNVLANGIGPAGYAVVYGPVGKPTVQRFSLGFPAATFSPDHPLAYLQRGVRRGTYRPVRHEDRERLRT
jgi:hypothetical protein